MIGLAIVIIISHLTLAILLFFGVNWIGKHAVEFGYSSMTLFEEANDSAALNFFLRAVSPAVFIIAVSAIVVALEHPEWRLGIYWVVIDYYVVRTVVVFLINRERLVNWTKFILHVATGTVVAMIAYQYLIIPNHSLLPNWEQMGNELWLAILAFLYAVGNKVPVSTEPGARRRNNFVAANYAEARSQYDTVIRMKASADMLQLIVYGVLIYENYARPPAIRAIERQLFWKSFRTTGIMQVAAQQPLSDAESVSLGVDILANSWANHAGEQTAGQRACKVIADYNRDSDYVNKVMRVMEILAKRVDANFLPTYESMWASPEPSGP